MNFYPDITSLKDTVLLRDIVERHKIRDVNTLDDLFVYIVNNATKLFTPNTIVKYYKGKGKTVNYETVSAYLTYLTDTYLVHRAERYNIHGKETISRHGTFTRNSQRYPDNPEKIVT